MQKPHNSSFCLGCRTFFEQNETLPLECMTVEYKNYNLPLSEPKSKWNILKTIVSFLNSKGGTIYIGVEDVNCKVIGKSLTSKSRDQFKLALLQIVQRIVPTVDLNMKEQLSVQFVPVVRNKVFISKYVVKIIVQQGDPSQTYCFTQKVQWAPQGKKDIENQCQNFQVVYSYYRHNMGGARQVKGMKLVQEAIKKAQNPSPKFTTFHEECNPEPPELQVQVKRIGFKNLGNRESRRKFQQLFKENLQKLKAEFQIVYDTEFKAVVIELPTVEEFKRINNFIRTNLSFLNESSEEVRFVQSGDYLDIHFYENLNGKGEDDQNNSPQKKKPQKGVQDSPLKAQQKQEQKMEQKSEKPEKKPQKKKFVQVPRQAQTKSQTQGQQQINSLTFTHINPHISDRLLNYLTVSVSKKINIITSTYQNTVEVMFSCFQDFFRYSTICMQNNHLKALQTFGFHSQIRIGINTGHLHILNYDKNKEQKAVNFLKSKMGKSLKEIEVLKKGSRYIIDCKMMTRGLACEWLDNLLTCKELKAFCIPGAQNNSQPKMKIFIHCEEVKV